MSIEVEKVSKLYGAQKALDNVKFSVKTGEIVGIILYFFGHNRHTVDIGRSETSDCGTICYPLFPNHFYTAGALTGRQSFKIKVP